MTQHQEPAFEAGISDILAGMTEQFQPDVSQTSNLGFDALQEQALNVQEDQRKKPASPLSIDAVKSFLREHFPNDRMDFAASVVQESLRELQSTSSNADVSSIPATVSALDMDMFPPSMRNGVAGFSCPYQGCPKFQRRKCELKKHYKRHTLPWACTVDMCHKPCGSKNDWKRHESRLHEQQESWRCEEVHSNISGRSNPSPRDDACKRLFSTKDLYLKHLDDQHKIRESGLVSKLVKTQRIGPKSKGQYWCGFCNKIVVMKAIGVEGDSERYNHIDHHFTKEGLKISQWKPLNGRPVPGDSANAAESGHNSPESSCSGGCSAEEGDGDAAVDADVEQPSGGHSAPRKRPAPAPGAGNLGPAAKVARSAGSRAHTARTHMVSCCKCVNNFQSWNSACIFCNHQVCSSCSAELVEQMDQI